MMRLFARKNINAIGTILLVLLLSGSGRLMAQHGWSVNPADYQNSGDITGIVFLDDVEMTDGALAAFVGDECRGFDDSPELAPSGYTVFQFLVYSDTASGETVRFRFYNNADGQTYDVLETVEFTNNMVLGNAFEPLEFHAITNDVPYVSAPVPDQVYQEYFASATIDLATVFSDPDLDPLTFSASSSDSEIVSVGISGSILSITEQGLGSSTITVTAEDLLASAEDEFDVTVENVNDAPEVANPLNDLTRDEGFGTETVDLSSTFSDKDGDALTFNAVSGDPGVVTVAVSGSILTITEVDPGSSTITVTASDGAATMDEAFVFVMNNVNDAPVVASAIANQNPDEYFGSLVIDLTDTFFDEDGDVLALSASSNNTDVVTVSVDGMELTLIEQGLGSSVITIMASDGEYDASDVFNVIVNNVNDAPEVETPVADQSFPEYFANSNLDLSGVFSDKDGDALTLTAVSDDTGVITVNINGTTITFIEQGLGIATVTVTADDGTLSVSDEFNVEVENVNDPPVVDDPLDNMVLQENFGTTQVDLTTVFFDKDSDDLTLSAVSSNTGVVDVSVSGATLTITERGLGNATITISANDAEYTVSDNFNLSVTNTNDPPEVSNPIADQGFNEHFGTAGISISSTFIDPDGDVLTYSASSDNPGIVTAGVSGTTLIITEIGLGTAVITVTASDGALTVDEVFSVTVNDVNDQPIVSGPIDNFDLDEGFGTHQVDLTPVFSDPDGDVLSLSAMSSNTGVAGVTISGTNLVISETGLGTVTITLTASDGSLQVQEQFTLAINNVNDLPLIISPITDKQLDEGFSTLSINLATVFTDPDGDALSFSASSSNTGVVAVSVTNSVMTITEAGIGQSVITVVANDGSSDVADEFSVRVNNVNDRPVLESYIENQSFTEYFSSATINISEIFSDPDGDQLTIAAVSSNTGVVSASVSGSTLTITEVGLGNAVITVTASDGSMSVSDQFTVTVINVNDPPTVVSAISDRIYDEGFGAASISVGPVFSDKDGDVMTYSVISNDPSVITVSMSGTILTITEVGLGSATVTVSASDGVLNTTEIFIVTVNNLNDAPEVVNPVADQDLNEYFTTRVIDLSTVFSDRDGDVLNLSSSSSNTNVVTTSISGSILTLTEQGLGGAIITITASDGSLSVENQFHVNVNNVNDAPVVAVSIPDISLDEHFGVTSIDLSGVFTDKDGDELTLTAQNSNPSAASIGITGTSLTITEAGLGSTTVTIGASDGSLGVSEQFIITINNVNDSPVIDNPPADQQYNERFGSTSVSLAALFSDPDGDDLTLSVSNSMPGVVSLVLTGTTLTINEVGLGTSVITVTADDGSLDVSAQFSFTVINVNDPPELVSPITDRSYPEYFGSRVIDIGEVFSDPDGDVLTLTVESSDEQVVTAGISGFDLTIRETGLGTSVITIWADDGEYTEYVEFNTVVTNVNDAPVVENPVSDLVLNEHFTSTTIALGNVFSDKDGDDLSLSVISNNTSVVDVSLSGTTLTILEAGLGSTQVIVTASDGNLSVDEQFIVAVNNVNDPPVVENQLADLILNEHFGTRTVDISQVFSDADGDVILLSASSNQTDVVTVLISGTNLIIREAGLGDAVVTVTGSDGTLNATEQFNVSVNNVNDAPEVIAPLSSVSRNEGFGTEIIDLSPVFIDPDGDALSFSAVSSNINSVTVQISGTTLTISEAGLGASTITVTATDGTFNTIDQFTFAIDNVNDPPEILQSIGNREYDEGFGTSNVNLGTIFSDPDGDVLTFSATSSNPSIVTVSVSGSTLTISEEGIGFASVTVTATDGSLETDHSFLAIVNNINDAPELISPIDDQSFAEYFASATVNISEVFEDPDGDILQITAISSNTSVVTAEISGSTLTMMEQGLGTSTVTVTASDGSLTVSDQFIVTVGNVNDPPVVVNPQPDKTFQEGFVSVSISLATIFSDQDGDVLTLSAQSSDSDIVSVSLSGTTLTLNETGLGTVEITVSASDGILEATDQFVVDVLNVNDRPVVDRPILDRNLFEYFGSVDIDLASVFYDQDIDDQLTYTALSNDEDVVTVTISGSMLTVSEAGLGSSLIYVTATDDGDGNLSVTDEFMVTVKNVNDPPVVEESVQDIVIDENFESLEIDFNLVFSDKDEDVLQITPVSSNPGIVSVSVSGSIVTLNEEGLGTANVTVTASDGSLSVDDQFSITINNVNDAPVVDNPVADLSYNEYFTVATVDFTNVFSDKDGDDLTYMVTSNDTEVVTASITSTTLTINEVGLGTATLVLTASDGEFSIDDRIKIVVNNVNDRPVLENPITNQTVDEYFGSVEIDIAPVFSDKDNDPLSYAIVSSDERIVTAAVDGTMMTISEAGLGTVTITVTASDGFLSREDSFDFTVNNVNDAPVVERPLIDRAYNEYFASTEIDISGVFSDKDEDDLDLSVVSSNENVIGVELSPTSLTISEKGLGRSTVTITASDGLLTVDEAFEVIVNNVNDAPVVANPLADLEVFEYAGPFTVELAGVFSDKDGDELSLSATSENADVVAVSVDGTTLTIVEVAPGTSVITVRAGDGQLSGTDQFLLTLANVNDAPVVVRKLNNISLSEYFTEEFLDISGVFGDKDRDVLTYSAESSNTNVVAVAVVEDTLLRINEEGMGNSFIILTASDGELTATEAFNISVDNVNDQPVIDDSIRPRVVNEHFGRDTIDLSLVFRDPDRNDTLTYSATSGDVSLVTVSTDSNLLIIGEAGLGTTSITATATDQGGLSVSDKFSITVENVNDPPVVSDPVDDFELVDNIGVAEFVLENIFSDPDDDSLTYTVTVSDTLLVSCTLTDSLLVIEALDEGIAEIILTATDTALSVSDTINVTVLREYLLILMLDDTRIRDEDTLTLCNEADQIFINVNTEAIWEFRKQGSIPWLIVSVEEDSILSVAFSENLTGADRLGSIYLSDDQGHEMEFTIRQTEDCLPDGIGRDILTGIEVYPNPVEEYLYISLDGAVLTGARVEFLDSRGTILYQDEVTRESGRYLEIGMQDLKEGIYFIRIISEKGYFIRKVVKL